MKEGKKIKIEKINERVEEILRKEGLKEIKEGDVERVIVEGEREN